MEQEITYKKCSKCGEQKPLTSEYFYRNATKKIGFRYDCKDCSKKRDTKYYQNNREKSILKSKNWIENNRDRVNKRKRERYNNNNIIVIISRVRCRISDMVRNNGFTKRSRTKDYIGCDWETFKRYIEKQFTDSMSWDNRDEWQLDHYYPISLAQTEEDMYIFNHYTNFQPLWESDNKSKKDTIPDGFEEWYEMMKKKVL